jgi:polar amino acid transport system substrate-binding protein
MVPIALGSASLLLALTFLTSLNQAMAAAPVAQADPGPERPLKIAIRLLEPEAFKENGELVGFSVDLGRQLMATMGRTSTLQTYEQINPILAAISTGKADIAIASIPVTKAGLENFEFSHPFLAGDLQILTLLPRQQQSNLELDLLRRLTDPTLIRFYQVILTLIILEAHLVWFLERRHSDEPGAAHYFPGIFHSLWWTFLALLGTPQSMPKGLVSKLTGATWLFIGIVFIAFLGGIITAEITVKELGGSINSLTDLTERRVAVIDDPMAIAYLQRHNVRLIEPFQKPAEALQSLLDHKVEADVAPTPQLRFMALRKGMGRVRIVGSPFLYRSYAVLMKKGSALRLPVNRSLLAMRENGIYEKIVETWFGSPF